MSERKALVVQMQTPADETGKRKDMFPRTVAQAIEYFDKDGNQTTLENFLRKNIEDGGAIRQDIPYLSETEPDHSCLWAKVKSIETGEE